jgi:hypothetical protein
MYARTLTRIQFLITFASEKIPSSYQSPLSFGLLKCSAGEVLWREAGEDLGLPAKARRREGGKKKKRKAETLKS